VAHRLRGRCKKVASISPPSFPFTDQPQVRLVHERRRLQRLTRGLIRQLGRSEPPQFIINQGQQFIRGPGIFSND
jgi:hypothetical protein